MINKTFKAKLESEILIKAVRSSGKGGQNVNKVSSKIEVMFDVRNSALLSDEQKKLIFSKNITDKNGFIRVTSQKYRSQFLNREDAVDKLLEILKNSFKVKRKRIKTKPSVISAQERLKEKRIISEKKKMRKINSDVD